MAYRGNGPRRRSAVDACKIPGPREAGGNESMSAHMQEHELQQVDRDTSTLVAIRGGRRLVQLPEEDPHAPRGHRAEALERSLCEGTPLIFPPDEQHGEAAIHEWAKHMWPGATPGGRPAAASNHRRQRGKTQRAQWTTRRHNRQPGNKTTRQPTPEQSVALKSNLR